MTDANASRRDGEIGVDVGTGDFVVRKICRSIEIRQQRHDGIAGWLQAAGQIAAQIAQRELQSLGGAGGDDIEHRFGLRQIEPPIEKSAQGEFARFGMARPGGDNDPQGFPHG